MNERKFNVVTELFAYCVKNNCGMSYNPARSYIDIDVYGVNLMWKRVSLELVIDDDGCVECATLYREEESEPTETLDLPYRDAMTCLEDIVARYQL